MAYVIAQPCIGVKDKTCVDVCPVDCIHGDDDSPQMYINPGECIDCGMCEVECPVEAIFQDMVLPEEWKHFEQINAEYFDA
jgi:ferredoxin